MGTFFGLLLSFLSFTDATLTARLERGHAGVILLWSPAMPLSRRALAPVRAAAAAEHWDIDVLVDDETSALGESVVASRALVALGATRHFPSVVFYENGRLLGDAIPGLKDAATYRRLFHERRTQRHELRLPPTAEPLPTMEAAFVEARELGPSYFFKATGDGSAVTFPGISGNWHLNLATGTATPLPGREDPVTTPDGRYLTTPGPLQFFLLADALASPQAPAVFTDETMADYYQAVGRLSGGGYRVLTGRSFGTRYRDYRETLAPVAAAKKICEGVTLSLPMMTRDGKTLTARAETTAGPETWLVNIDGGPCQVRKKIPYATNKATLSADGAWLVYAAEVMLPAGSAPPATHEVFLHRLADDKLFRLDDKIGNARRGYPDFLPDGRLVYSIRKHDTGRRGFIAARPAVPLL